MTQDTEDVVARVAAMLSESEAVESLSAMLRCADVRELLAENEALKHDLERQMTIANIECHEAQSLSDRIDVLEAENAALRAKRKLKIVPAPPVVLEDDGACPLRTCPRRTPSGGYRAGELRHRHQAHWIAPQ